MCSEQGIKDGENGLKEDTEKGEEIEAHKRRVDDECNWGRHQKLAAELIKVWLVLSLLPPIVQK